MNQRNRKLLFILFGLLMFLPVAVWAAQKMGGGFNAYPQQPSYFSFVWYIFKERIGQLLLSALFGGIIGAFFSQKLRKFRKRFFIVLFVLGAAIGILLNAWLGNITFFFLGAGAAYYLLREAVKAVAKAKKKKLSTYGTAEWANLEHLTENELIGKEGFVLGAYVENNASYPLHYKKDRHLLTVAPTRSGKGVSSIIPNLLTYEGSVIVIDPKGENALITAARRGAGDPDRNIPGMGQKVHVVDPWGITGLPASRFNPFDWLDPDDPDINENAMMLADSIVVPREGSLEAFWDEESKALLMGFLLHVAIDYDEQQNRNLGRVRDIICMGSSDLTVILNHMMSSPNSIVSSTATRTTAKEERLKSNVLASLQAHTHFLDSPRIRESLSKSDFKFEDLKTSKMTVYLVLPADRLQTFGRWLRLLIQQALTVNARNIELKPDKPVLFLLDEMAALGRLTMVEQAYSLMAGFGMQLWGIIQDLSQLERIYGKGWETFIGNSGVLQYFGSRDNKTAGYFSKLCGVTTVEKTSFANSIAKAISQGWSSSSTAGSSTSGSSTSISDTTTESNTTDVVQRHLAYPDELMVLREDKQLVLIENFNPIPAKKDPWFNDDELNKLGIDLQKMDTNILRPAAIKPSLQPAFSAREFMKSVVLKEETYEKMKGFAAGFDIHKIEQEWRNLLIKKNRKTRNPDNDFISYCNWIISNYKKLQIDVAEDVETTDDNGDDENSDLLRF